MQFSVLKFLVVDVDLQLRVPSQLHFIYTDKLRLLHILFTNCKIIMPKLAGSYPQFFHIKKGCTIAPFLNYWHSSS